MKVITNTIDFGSVMDLVKKTWFRKNWSYEQPSDSVSEYFQLKHFDQPQNRNIKMTNIRANTIQIYSDNKFLYVDKKVTLANMAEKILDELRDVFNAEKKCGENTPVEKLVPRA